VGQAAGERTYQGLGQVDEPPRDPAAVHELAGQNEERHRQQRERVQARGHTLCHRGQGRLRRDAGQHGQGRGDPDGEGHGDADRQQRDE
jgi:hypothetical protein